MAVEVIQKGIGYLLEGPHWDDKTGTLLFTNILGKTVYRYDPGTGKTVQVKLDDQVSAAVPTRSGRTLVTATHKIGFLDWETGNIEVLTEVDAGKPEMRFNDAKCDAAGRLWAGTMAFETLIEGTAEKPILDGRSSLYCFYPDRTITEHLQDVNLSNGLAWTADKKTMYYIDSFKHGVDAFDYDITRGAISNKRRIITVPESEGFPDGMCIDSEGMLWVAHFFGSSIKRYNPMTGEILRTVKFPTSNITSCCWGGPNFDELYVTSAKVSLSDEQLKEQDAAGSLFRVTGLGVTGVKAEVFNDEC